MWQASAKQNKADTGIATLWRDAGQRGWTLSPSQRALPGRGHRCRLRMKWNARWNLCCPAGSIRPLAESFPLSANALKLCEKVKPERDDRKSS